MPIENSINLNIKEKKVSDQLYEYFKDFNVGYKKSYIMSWNII